MKKILLVLLMTVMCMSGCSKPEETGNVGGKGSTWDCVEYDTIEEMNSVAGTNIVSASVAGKSDEWFGVISGNLAQYKFVVNGEDWCIRASKDVDNDISGLNYDDIGFEKDMTSTYYNDEVYAFRFFNNDIQYVISLTVTGKDIKRSYFDNICNDFKTRITGVKSGYENEIIEDGDTVVYRTTIYNDDGTTLIMEVNYTFENDKMVSIINNNIFETEEAAKEYYDLLIESGTSKDSIKLEGNTITSDMSANVDFYSDMNKESFMKSMEDAMNQ